MSFDPQQFLKNAPTKPGVYRMYNADAKILYVGKAKNLKKRLQSYFRENLDSGKTQLLMSKVTDVQVTVTHSENEALILENNLIKELRPRYNILMRDDKSYPFIVLSKHPQFPRIYSYRGVRRKDQNYFGPYPNGLAVKESLELMQKLFQIRSCTESVFNNRSRPCLQHQIKRCSAPCVGLASPEDYQQDIARAELFLRGKSKELVKQLEIKMQQAAAALNFEVAANLRDQISKLNVIQEQQHVMQDSGNFDVVVIGLQLEQVGLTVLNVQDGKLMGNKNHFFKLNKDSLANILSAFLSQYYLSADSVPKQIFTDLEPTDVNWLSSALTEFSEHKVELSVPQRGERKQWIALAQSNLQQALSTHVQETLTQLQRWQALTSALGLATPPERVECFDISHSQGEATVASCVVFNKNGADKKSYRRFNIKDITPGDDYAALHQAITRRYHRIAKEGTTWPDLVIIDGGKGQLQQAIMVFKDLNIDTVTLISISKGPGRNANYDVIWRPGLQVPLTLTDNTVAMHQIQQIRDEAHRFAITGHKAQRGKLRTTSILEQIEGVGAKRRRELLKRFGGLQGLQKASVEEIVQCEGISEGLAVKIYHHLH
jgi:excinuclease ABC subunit C